MSKRPLEQSNAHFKEPKRSKTGFDHFNAPRNQNRPQTSTSYAQRNNILQASSAAQPPRPTIRPPSIRDSPKKNEFDYLLDDDDDDVIVLASQKVEIIEKACEQLQSQQFDLNYSEFQQIAQSSTQLSIKPPPSGFTEQIRGNLFDIGGDTECTDFRQPFQNVPTAQHDYSNSHKNSTNSQKENLMSTKIQLLDSISRVKALTEKNRQLEKASAELQDKILEKDGEAKNLRITLNSLQKTIDDARRQKVNEAITLRNDPEKEKLRSEIDKLKTLLAFNHHNTSVQRLNNSISVAESKKEQNVIYHTSSFLQYTPDVKVHRRIFDIDDGLYHDLVDHVINVQKRDMSKIVVRIQATLALMYGKLLLGIKLKKPTIDELFEDARYIMVHISDYIQYLEEDKYENVVEDCYHVQRLSTLLSIPYLREQQIAHDEVNLTMKPDVWARSVFQAKDLFEGEELAKPRRIIAFYSAIASHSKEFCEKLMLANAFDNENDPPTNQQSQHHRTSTDREPVNSRSSTENILLVHHVSNDIKLKSFVFLLTEVLEKYVSESQHLFDYSGFVVASAHLLASLGSFYNEYTKLQMIDEILEGLLCAILGCHINVALIMQPLLQFFIDISKNPSRSNLASRLCLNTKWNHVEYNKTYKFYQMPRNTCPMQLFLMTMQATFDDSKTYNSRDIEFLLKLTVNLNRMVHNFAALGANVLKFLRNQSSDFDPNENCHCMHSLLNSMVQMNNLCFKQKNITSNANIALMQEVASSCVVSFRWLWKRLDKNKEQDMMLYNQTEKLLHSIAKDNALLAYMDFEDLHIKNCIPGISMRPELKYENIDDEMIGVNEVEAELKSNHTEIAYKNLFHELV